MSMYDKAIVASGHNLVSRTAAEIMREGGNAFDAVVAAGFVSAVVEPSLTSLGGGGLLLGWSEKRNQELFFDFFVNTPGVGRDNSFTPHFFPITVNFSGSTQDFNVGLGSVAVPGTLKGLLHIHDRLGHMGLKDVLTPARELARAHVVNEQQGHFLELLYPIMTLMPAGKKLYEPDGTYLKSGETLHNQASADFIDQLVDDRGESFYRGDIARRVDREMSAGRGYLTRADLAAYEVIERAPLKIPYRNYTLCTSPEPSMGGTLIGLSIGLMGKMKVQTEKWGEGNQLRQTVSLMQEVEKLRENGVTTPNDLINYFNDPDNYQKSIAAMRTFSRGTTHVSVSDRDGNCASMTCSNGEGSGYFAPGTGVMLNNMMGEDDLHPHGFHTSPPGLRVGSMMSPSLLMENDRVKLVIGSGGSKRIRTAVSQVLSQVVDFGRSIDEAVCSPRLYWDGSTVQVEPGFSSKAIEGLACSFDVNVWDRQDVYFGGVHAVVPGHKGVGDPRRGGAVSVVKKKQE